MYETLGVVLLSSSRWSQRGPCPNPQPRQIPQATGMLHVKVHIIFISILETTSLISAIFQAARDGDINTFVRKQEKAATRHVALDNYVIDLY